MVFIKSLFGFWTIKNRILVITKGKITININSERLKAISHSKEGDYI